MQELANQGLMQAGQKWQENNKNLVEGNKATADFQAATAQLAETVAPIITQITQIAAGLLEKFNALPPSTQRIIGATSRDIYKFVGVAFNLVICIGSQWGSVIKCRRMMRKS